MYERYHLAKRSSFTVDDDYTKFYIYPDRVHEIASVFVTVETSVDPSGWLEVGSDNNWSHISPNNYITLTGSFISIYDAKTVRVRHIPKIFNNMATNEVARNLIETTSVVNGEELTNPLYTRIDDRITRYKADLRPRGIRRSSQNLEFDRYDYTSYSQSELRN